jgi:hypothetical protein
MSPKSAKIVGSTPALPASRVAVPRALAAICSTEDRDRACHSLGKSYVDTVRAFRGRYEHVVDVVVRTLRHKLGPAALIVETVRGSGYRLRADWRAHLS